MPDPEVVLLMEHLEGGPVNACEMQSGTARDSLLSWVLQFVTSGWSNECADAQLKPLWSRRSELSVQQGCRCGAVVWWYQFPSAKSVKGTS